MKEFIILVYLIYLLSSCHKGCSCNADQVCLDNTTCVCSEFTEGNNCTPMRNKFIGTFIGNLSLNGGTPIPDTIEFFGGGGPINFVYSQVLRGPIISGFGVHVESSLLAIYYENYIQTNVANIYLDDNNFIDCGDAAISSDYKTLTITYHPVIDSGVIDFNNKYTFVGTKQ